MSTTARKPVRVMLVDDSEVVRMGLRALLSAEPTLEIAGEASSVASAIETCGRVKPDVLLLDLASPLGPGVTRVDRAGRCAHPARQGQLWR